ncbi:MobF family relaxase [Streptosporangium sp. NPDC002544]|uniref:MobF family relaxase n=1 Tax=Streptosporangium sp. NPDC002544 TaxID=3154538 RepID=UPI0033203FD9
MSTLGPDQAQVDYRLREGAGCGVPELQADAQLAYRLTGERPLMWIGDGLREVGLTPGSPLTADQHDAARALMDGRHPHTGEVLVAAKLAVDPRAMLPGALLLAALQQAAIERGAAAVSALVRGNDAMTKRAARLERGVQRKGEAYVLAYEDARKLAKAVGLDLADVYDGDQLAEARRWREARVRVGNRGYDLTLDVSKSVSLLQALSSPEVGAAVQTMFAQSVVETVAAVQEWVAYGQRGHQGDDELAERIASSGLLGWILEHRTARPVDGQAPDPHLHAHVQIANMVRGVDGRWSAVAAGGRDLFRHAHAADAFLKARVRRQTIEAFGVRWERDAHTGAWEIVGVDETMRARFSKRDTQVKAVLAERGIAYEEAHQHARRVASATSRQPKGDAVAAGELSANWHAQCAANGVDAAAVMALCLHPGEGLPQRPSAQQIAAWIWRADGGLTAHAKVVTRADVFAVVADACPDGIADRADAEALTDAVLACEPAVRLPDTGARHLVNSARYTSIDVLEAEEQILRLTRERYDEGAAVLEAATIALAIDAYEVAGAFTFSPAQRHALERLLGGGLGVEALLGVAGAGKTTLMDAARAGWESRGLVVAGAATSAVAAANLTAESGIASRTIAAWLHSIADPDRPGLDGVDVLVIDEAAMADDRELAVLLGEAHRTGTKVVAIGDPLQLRAIGVGGAFAAIHRQVDGVVLDENRRQRDPIERQALQAWREGDREEALRTWNRGGRVHAGRDSSDTLAAMLTDWSRIRTYAGEVHDELAAVLVLAGTNADVERLNAAARALRRRAGELSGTEVLYRLPGGRTLALAVGDHVRVRQNDYRARKSRGRRADVLNGYRGVVVAIHSDRSVTVEWRRTGADGPTLVVERVSAAYIGAGGLSHGTAMTVAAAQGLTGQHTLVYGMGLDPHTLYTAMSRDRLSAHLYLPRTVLESDADRARHGQPRNHTEELHRALDAYAATLQGDRADEFLTAEPEPIAAVRARQQEAAEVKAVAELAEQRVANAMLTDVTRPDRPHGLLEEETLQARITTVSATVAGLAGRVAAEERRERAEAEQAAAIRTQVRGELIDERDRLIPALRDLQYHLIACDARRAAQRQVNQLQAKLEQAQRGVRGRLPSRERSRLHDQLQQARQRLEPAARGVEAAVRAEQAALRTALEISPSCTNATDLQRRLRILTGSASFTTTAEKEIAARVDQALPGFADRRRVQAAWLSFAGRGSELTDQHRRANRALSALLAERDYRDQLAPALRQVQEQARRDPAAPALAKARREHAQQQAQQRPVKPGPAYRPPSSPRLSPSSRRRGHGL